MKAPAMGLLDLFGMGPLSPGKIDKIAKLASNPFAQPDVRMRELGRLMKDGTEPAIKGALKRFTQNASGHIADEDEKKWLEDRLVEEGAPALGPLSEYLRHEERITYALRAYQRIAGDERAVGFFIEVLNAYGPEDYRSSEAKLQLILALGEHLADARVLPALVPFLRDHSDDVRFAVLDLLERVYKDKKLPPEVERAALENFTHLILTDEAAPRIQRRAAELCADSEWSLPGDAVTFPTLLEEDFFLDKKRIVRRRVAKKT
jgi:hypothetical protein